MLRRNERNLDKIPVGAQMCIRDRSPSGQPPYLALIHRLDQPVAGLLVFARTPAAAKTLNQQLTSHQFGKYYRALVFGQPPKDEGTLENYLVKDSRSKDVYKRQFPVP